MRYYRVTTLAEPGMAADYTDLVVWQRSVDLLAEVYALTRRLPRNEQFGFISQLQRAASSIPANIAEGNGRFHRGDYLRHLSIAHGSLMELTSHLHACERLHIVSPEQAAPLLARSSEVGRMLRGLIVSLRR